jgi:hypothetical protein
VHIQEPTADGFSFTDTTVGTFVDAGADGPFTITAANANQITLSTAGGRTYHFNLQSHRFG